MGVPLTVSPSAPTGEQKAPGCADCFGAGWVVDVVVVGSGLVVEVVGASVVKVVVVEVSAVAVVGVVVAVTVGSDDEGGAVVGWVVEVAIVSSVNCVPSWLGGWNAIWMD